MFLNVVSCPEGLAALAASFPEVAVVTAGVDPGLNEHKYIVPVPRHSFALVEGRLGEGGQGGGALSGEAMPGGLNVIECSVTFSRS
jgi:hypothetical protein